MKKQKEKCLFAVEVVDAALCLHMQTAQSVKPERKIIFGRDVLPHVLLEDTWAQRFVSF